MNKSGSNCLPSINVRFGLRMGRGDDFTWAMIECILEVNYQSAEIQAPKKLDVIRVKLMILWASCFLAAIWVLTRAMYGSLSWLWFKGIYLCKLILLCITRLIKNM